MFSFAPTNAFLPVIDRYIYLVTYINYNGVMLYKIAISILIIIKIFIGSESKTKMRKKSNMIYRYENIKIELCTDIKCKVGMTEN